MDRLEFVELTSAACELTKCKFRGSRWLHLMSFRKNNGILFVLKFRWLIACNRHEAVHVKLLRGFWVEVYPFFGWFARNDLAFNLSFDCILWCFGNGLPASCHHVWLSFHCQQRWRCQWKKMAGSLKFFKHRVMPFSFASQSAWFRFRVAVPLLAACGCSSTKRLEEAFEISIRTRVFFRPTDMITWLYDSLLYCHRGNVFDSRMPGTVVSWGSVTYLGSFGHRFVCWVFNARRNMCACWIFSISLACAWHARFSQNFVSSFTGKCRASTLEAHA